MAFKRVPLWKIKRELRRVGRQATNDLPNWFLEQWEYYHFRYFSRERLVVDKGQQGFSSKVVVYLVFPTAGIRKSHVSTLKYFVGKGFSPLVISNLPLSADEISQLAPYAWKTIQRSNFGYDFGGYREGILYLQRDLQKLTELVLANDSVWYPVSGDDHFFQKARASGAHFFGTITCHGSKRRYYLKEFENVVWDWDENDGHYHIASFLLWLKKDLFRDPKFLRFWMRMRISNDKHKTVRRGEIGLTQFIRKHGYKIGESIDLGKFDQVIWSLDSDDLKEILENITPDLSDEKMDILSQHIKAFDSSNAWKNSARKMILAIATRHHAAYFSTSLVIRHLGGNFMKKALFPKTKATADKALNLLDRYPQYFTDEMQREIRETFRSTHLPDVQDT